MVVVRIHAPLPIRRDMKYNEDRLKHISDDVIAELKRATEKFGEFQSCHEGYAIILEELDELWDVIKNNEGKCGEMKRYRLMEEATQVAAMAIRFIYDMCYAHETAREKMRR
jgi:RNAse (barnase) inhibitor barstar